MEITTYDEKGEAFRTKMAAVKTSRLAALGISSNPRSKPILIES